MSSSRKSSKSCGCKMNSKRITIPKQPDVVFLFWKKNPLRPNSLRRIRKVSIVGNASPCRSQLVIGNSLVKAGTCLLKNGFVIACNQKTTAVSGFVVFKRGGGPGQPNNCSSDSHLRQPGIKSRASGVYFADANLICSGACSGEDKDTVYVWTLTPLNKDNPGNLRIVGKRQKTGDNTVQVAGTGTFDLRVDVLFTCFFGILKFQTNAFATVRFTKQ